MPALHKRPESPYWVASYQDASGRWLKKSTKTKERTLALKLALEWERACKAGRAGRLVEAQCRKVLSEIHEHSNGAPLLFHTCRDWFSEWLAGKTGATTARTIAKYQQVSDDFLQYLGERADLPLNAVSQRDVRGFRDFLSAAGHSPSTVNQTIRKVLSGPFLAAQRNGFIPINPCSSVDALKDDGDKEKDVFTPAQIISLLDTAEGDWKGLILAGYFTGLRLKDITEMRWDALDLETGLLQLKAAKTGGRLTIPLAPELKDWLKLQPRGIGRAPVFPTLAGKSGAGKSGLSMQFKRIMDKAGVKGRVLRERQENGAGRTQSSLSFHSLRHSFNSALANAGVSQEIRQKLTGHASAAMNAKYTHLEIEGLRAAVDSLPTLPKSAIK